MYKCQDFNPNDKVFSSLLFATILSIPGFALLYYLVIHLGFRQALNQYGITLMAAVSLLFIWLAYDIVKGLWANRNLKPVSSTIVLNEHSLEHHIGLVKTIISYSAIKEISKDRESKTSIIKLTDGGFYPLPQTINEKELLLQLGSKLTNDS